MKILNLKKSIFLLVFLAFGQSFAQARLPDCWFSPSVYTGEFVLRPNGEQSKRDMLLLLSYSKQNNLEISTIRPQLRREELSVTVKPRELEKALNDDFYRSEVEKQIAGIVKSLDMIVECEGRQDGGAR